ncbi:MAG: type I restriction enzyme HsdR N-terminal domain-containing protein, partial [Candidatus Micrarchaeota archaeon]
TAKERPANPEEIVRQLYLCKLIHADDYPKDRIAVEKGAFWGQAKMIIADRWDESVSTSAGKKVITHVLVRGFSADLAPRGATRAARPQKWRSR